MKKIIYVLPHTPTLTEFSKTLEQLTPPLSEPLANRARESFTQIQDRLKKIPVNAKNFHFKQSQTFSDSSHTIILKGQLKKPSLIEKLSGLIE